MVRSPSTTKILALKKIGPLEGPIEEAKSIADLMRDSTVTTATERPDKENKDDCSQYGHGNTA